MAAVATLGSYRRSSFKIYTAACVVVAMLCIWDGYLSKDFINKHTENGKPDSTLAANQMAPFVFLPAAIVITVRWWMVKGKRVVADGKALILENGDKIDYDRIEKIDKTRFEKSGFFIVTYKNDAGKEADIKLSDRQYDNLEGVLAELVAALKGGPA